MEEQLTRVESVHAVPGRRSRMGRLAVEMIFKGRDGDDIRHHHVVVVQMHHHGHVVGIEDAGIRHVTLGTVRLLAGRTDHVNVRVQFVLHADDRQSRQQADAARQAVAAGMADFRQRVVLREDGDLPAMGLAAGLFRKEGGFEAGERIFHRKAVTAQGLHQLRRSLVLLARKFLLVEDPFVELEHLVLVRIDRGESLLLQFLISSHVAASLFCIKENRRLLRASVCLELMAGLEPATC